MKDFYKIFLAFAIVYLCLPVGVFGVQTPNPRGGSSAGIRVDNVQNTKRAASTVVNRSASSKTITPRISGNVKSVSVSRAAINNHEHNSANKSRSAANPNRKTSIFSRAAKSTGAFLARSANNTSFNNTKVRSAKSHDTLKHLIRATAIYSDDSKIGGGYSECKNAFATCMDQFCAVANDTYRRCYCSDRFTEFKDTEEALDEALGLLADFQNNNLNAVDKTAAEVGAMYSSSEGEAALKKDTSASQKLLDSIGDVLSGSSKKKSSSPTPKRSSTSLGVMDLSSLSTSLDDIWSGGGDVFGSSNSSTWANNSANTDMTALEGKALYDDVYKQCSQVVSDSCSSEAMFNLARSSYSILIMQDCNAYEKNIGKKKQSVEDTVRTAEKYLREARLEEYRAHNSQDVNDCLSKVEKAIKQSTACGENYVKCLDYSGLYINPTTGAPIYSKALFGLNSLIVLDGSADILGANPDFNTFLDDKKQYVTQALDTCRSIADNVWTEFKKSAIIQIAQAQDDKIEEVKNSCISTMKECYDTQSNALADFDDTTAQSTGAIAAVTARGMCYEKVMACAALYGDPNGCSYNDKTKKITPASSDKVCGLQSLLTFVDNVDAVKIEEGCETGLKKYAEELCAPASGDTGREYPWGCRLRAVGKKGDSDNNPSSIYGALESYAKRICAQDLVDNDDANTIQASTTKSFKDTVNVNGKISAVVESIKTNLNIMLQKECSGVSEEGKDGGVAWDANGYTVDGTDNIVSVSPTWMEKVFGNGHDLKSVANTGIVGYTLTIEKTGEKYETVGEQKSFGWGVCMVPTVQQLCNMQSQMPGFSNSTNYKSSEHKCLFSDKWYSMKCSGMGGYWTGSECYVR